MTSKTPAKNKHADQSQDIGRRIKNLRDALGLTQTDFAKLIGKDVGTISRWERGELPTEYHRRLREVAMASGGSSRYLIAGEGEILSPSEKQVIPDTSIPHPGILKFEDGLTPAQRIALLTVRSDISKLSDQQLEKWFERYQATK